MGLPGKTNHLDKTKITIFADNDGKIELIKNQSGLVIV
jgi:hypothetical protein